MPIDGLNIDGLPRVPGIGPADDQITRIVRAVQRLWASPTVVNNINTVIDTRLVDEDNFASDSDTLAPTQQSTKAYIASVVAGYQALDADLTEIAGLSNVAGDILYTDGSANWNRLAKGSDGQVLTLASGLPSWAAASGGDGMLKTQNGGYFLSSTGGVTVTSNASGGTYGTWTEVIASTSADVFIVGLVAEINAPSSARTIVTFDIGTGAAASETSISEWAFGANTASSVGIISFEKVFPFPVPVASGTRIATRVYNSTGAFAYNVRLILINQADLASI